MPEYEDDDFELPPLLPLNYKSQPAPPMTALAVPEAQGVAPAVSTTDRKNLFYYTGSEADLYDAIAQEFDPKPSRVYQRGGTLLHVTRDEVLRVMTATPIDKAALYMAINRQFRVLRRDQRPTKKKTEDDSHEWLSAKIPNEVTDAYMATTHRPTVPELKAVVSSPVITESGEIRMAKGAGECELYDPETKLLACYRDGWPEDLPHPDEALETLRQVFIDTAFADPVDDFGAGLTLLLTMMARHLITDCPAYLMTAAAEGTGKSTFVEICAAIAYGIRKIPGRTFSSESEEMNKSLLSIGRSGLPMCFFDNIPTGSRIGSAPLEMALTSGVVASRVLGESKDANARFDCVVAFTANNPTASPDMARRLIVVRFDNKGVSPSQKDWKELDILTYVLRHRKKLWNSAASLLRYHLQELHRTTVKRRALNLDEREQRWAEVKDREERRLWKADYPSWSRIVLGAIEPWLKCNPLHSTTEFQIECNPDLADAGSVFQALFGQGRLTAGEIASRARDNPALRDALDAWGKAGMPPDSRAIGRKLSGYVDRHLSGLVLMARTEHNQKRFWVAEAEKRTEGEVAGGSNRFRGIKGGNN